MDKLTLERIKTLHPLIREDVRRYYLEVNSRLGKGVRLRFSWCYRTNEEQHKLFLKRPKVTNADSGQSIHNYGLAFDIVMLYDNDANGTFEEASWNTKRDGDRNGESDWATVTNYFESKGFKNGFTKSNGQKWDLPHFQKAWGYKWRDLKKIVDSGEVIRETINGKEYIYPIFYDAI